MCCRLTKFSDFKSCLLVSLTFVPRFVKMLLIFLAVFERLRNILNEGAIDKRVQYMLEVMFAIRKDQFKVWYLAVLISGPLACRKRNSRLFTAFSSCLFIGIKCHVSLIRFAEHKPSMVRNVQNMF